MSDLKPQTESLESLLSTAIGLLMGYEDRDGKGGTRNPYKPGSVIAKFVAECVERLKDWPYTDEAQPAITSETGNQAAQGASAITSESAQTGHDLMALIDRYWELAYAEGKEGRDHDTVDGAAADCRHAIESLVRSKLGAGVGWQPIETAPKDGTRVLLVINHGEWGDAVWTGLWADGWMVSYGKAQANPTHWMPLPPPPIVGKESK